MVYAQSHLDTPRHIYKTSVTRIIAANDGDSFSEDGSLVV